MAEAEILLQEVTTNPSPLAGDLPHGKERIKRKEFQKGPEGLPRCEVPQQQRGRR